MSYFFKLKETAVWGDFSETVAGLLLFVLGPGSKRSWRRSSTRHRL